MPENLQLGPWHDLDGRAAEERDGDDWQPGSPVMLRRTLTVEDKESLHREFGLQPGTRIAIGARWYCQATGMAGTHTGGPTPLDACIDVIEIEVPGTTAFAVELETCVVALGGAEGLQGLSAPDGGLLWSDGWSAETQAPLLVLEGSEMRVPVRTVSFYNKYPETKSALWAVELELPVEPDDLVANACTVFLNREVLDRDFRDADGEANASLLPDTIMTAITVDLVRSLTAAVGDDLEAYALDLDAQKGSVHQLLGVWLTECFGDATTAGRELTEDAEAFSRRLWSRFAPDSWMPRR